MGYYHLKFAANRKKRKVKSLEGRQAGTRDSNSEIEWQEDIICLFSLSIGMLESCRKSLGISTPYKEGQNK